MLVCELVHEERDEMNSKDGGPPAEVYLRYLESGRLGFQRCGDCEAAIFYPRVLCPVCGGSEVRWEASEGFGVIYATTAVYRRDLDPYNVALVDLDEGFRMMSRVDGVPAEEVEIGSRVELRVDQYAGGPVPVFVPAGEAG